MFWFVVGICSSFILCAGIRYLTNKNKEDVKGYILVERSTGIGGYMKDIRYISLYFNADNIYQEIDSNLEDENHFFVPLKGNERYLHRTMFKNTHLDGSVDYDHNGYSMMSKGEIKKAFKNLKKANPQFIY